VCDDYTLNVLAGFKEATIKRCWELMNRHYQSGFFKDILKLLHFILAIMYAVFTLRLGYGDRI
jgi:hypothetical protein